MGGDDLVSKSGPEVLLRAISGQLSAGQLRRFAHDCCRRISNICDYPVYFEMLKLIEQAAKQPSGSIARERLLQLNTEYRRLYSELYPGYGTPCAATLALVAVGEGCRDSALDAAISASSTAAEAMASSAAAPVDDAHYDFVHEKTYQNERQFQLDLLRQLCSAHREL